MGADGGQKERAGRSKRILAARIRRAVEFNIEATPFFIRDRRNLSAEFLTRSNDETMREWARRIEMARIPGPLWLINFANVGDKANWLGIAPNPISELPYPVRGACDVTATEWAGSNCIPMEFPNKFGCQADANILRWTNYHTTRSPFGAKGGQT